jgi:hypothetical protein
VEFIDLFLFVHTRIGCSPATTTEGLRRDELFWG